MVQLGVTIAEALVRLRAFAYAEGRPLVEVARDVVGGRLRFDEVPSAPRHRWSTLTCARPMLAGHDSLLTRPRPGSGLYTRFLYAFARRPLEH